MPDIYRYEDINDVRSVIEKMDALTQRIEEEKGKPEYEQDKDKLFELTYAKFIQGLYLSTGARIF
jgi:hypothetical protein